MNNPSDKKCKREDCSVEKDGKCLEGHTDLEKCPYYMSGGNVMDEPEEGVKEDLQLGEPGSFFDLPTGEDLNYELADRITAAALTRVIVLAGPVGSGKTTLLASIYDKFQEGDFAGYIFAGSETLNGFERRCHPSRIASERAAAETERTKPSFEQALLHLRVRVKDLSEPAQDILFTDISGEMFRMARDSEEDCQRLGILSRADHFVLFIDGEKLAQSDKRHEAFKDADLLLRSCTEAKMLGKWSFVDILFSKYDLINDKEDNEEILKFIELIKKRIEETYSGKMGRLRFSSVAARPAKGSSLPFAHGLEPIFATWVEDSPVYTSKRAYSRIDNKVVREFDTYFLKQIR